MFLSIQQQIHIQFQILNKMKKYSLQIATFLFLLFVGCSSENGEDVTEEIKMEAKSDQRYEYVNIDGTYILTSMYDNTNRNFTDVDGKVEDNSSIDSTDLPKEELGEYNNFEIIDINDKQVVILNNIYSTEDSYNTQLNWKFNCEITKGSLADFNRGETIEAKPIDDAEYDKAQEVMGKAIISNSFNRTDPYQSSIKFNSSNHVFLISKSKIIETSNSNFNASIKLLKEVKE